MPAATVSDTNTNTAPIFQRMHLRQLRLFEFCLHERGDAERPAVEDYIRRRFAGSHDADVNHFLPHLVSLGRSGQPCAAVGLADASRGPLFAETYLAAPIEQWVSSACGERVGRGDILEIGNLVSTWKGSSLLLFVFLGELIDRLGYRFAAFTATREVDRLLARLGHAPTVLVDADPACLSDGGLRWGRYYTHRPRVMFGEVRPAVQAARRELLYRAVARSLAPQVERVCAQWPRRPLADTSHA